MSPASTAGSCDSEKADLVALRIALSGPVSRQAPLIVHQKLHTVLAGAQQQRALKPVQKNRASTRGSQVTPLQDSTCMFAVRTVMQNIKGEGWY